MSWHLLVDDGVKKRLRKIPWPDAERIINATEEMALDPFKGDVEKMKGEENAWRRRVGSYRIFYEIFPERKLVYIGDLKRRTSSTY